MAKSKKSAKKLEDKPLEMSSADKPDDALDVVNATTAEAELSKSSEDAARPIPKAFPKKSSKPVPMPEKPLVRLEVFLKVAGPKWDQLAGFKLHAKKNKLGPMTIPEWRLALQQFMGKPTG